MKEGRSVSLHLVQNTLNLQKSRVGSKLSTCVIYLHGLASFCLEGTFLIKNLEKYLPEDNVSLCLYDMRGHGKDKASNVTFGLKESSQLFDILSYLKEKKQFQQFVLWGRSMGATTILKMLADYQDKLLKNNISIKFLVIDSAFQSFQRAAHEIISRKTGMPQIFSKGIFQYLLSTIQRVHKFKLIVETQKTKTLKIPAIFLYSENDSMISPQHTRLIYEQYEGTKHKVKMSVGHNSERPQEVLGEVFDRLRAEFKVKDWSMSEKRRSMSTKKVGLSVTKNKRVKTLQSGYDEGQDDMSNDRVQFEKQSNTLKNIQTDSIQLTLTKSTTSKKLANNPQPKLINKNSMKQSPKPYQIAKTPQNPTKRPLKLNEPTKQNQNQLNQEKQNINSLNVSSVKKAEGKPKGKKNTKLRVSQKDLVEEGQAQRMVEGKIREKRTSIYESLEAKNISIELFKSREINGQGLYEGNKKSDNTFKQVHSTMLISRSQQRPIQPQTVHKLQDISNKQIPFQTSKSLIFLNYPKPKSSLPFKTSPQQNPCLKKLSLNQSPTSTPYQHIIHLKAYHAVKPASEVIGKYGQQNQVVQPMKVIQQKQLKNPPMKESKLDNVIKQQLNKENDRIYMNHRVNLGLYSPQYSQMRPYSYNNELQGSCYRPNYKLSNQSYM